MKNIMLNNNELVSVESVDAAVNLVGEKLSYELAEYIRSETQTAQDDKEWFESEYNEINEIKVAALGMAETLSDKIRNSKEINKSDLIFDLLEIEQKLKK
mgnify:CR=1 FL=1